MFLSPINQLLLVPTAHVPFKEVFFFFFFCILLCVVPIWVVVMIGLEIGWSWRPRWTDLVYLGPRSKFCFIWTTPLGFRVCRLWLAFTVLSALLVGRTIWSNFKVKRKWDLRIMFAYGEILSLHTALMTSVVLCHDMADSFFFWCVWDLASLWCMMRLEWGGILECRLRYSIWSLRTCLKGIPSVKEN